MRHFYKNRFLFGLVCVLLWGLLSAGLLPAQETRGSIVGRVVDQSGAVIPNATVQVTNQAMGTKTSLVTNDQGFYQAMFLTPGLYRIEVEVKGFKKFMQDDVQVRINDRLEVNIKLTVGQPTETVTVTGETPLLENTTASLGQVIDARRVTELPLAHGNPYQLIGIAAGLGFTRDPRLDRPYEPTHIVGYSIAGTRANRSDLTIDGIASTATANANEVTATYPPPGDIIQEFKVQTSTFDASFGQTEGGVTNISIKSGTNALHGTAYFAGLPPAGWGWAANDFYANRLNQKIATFTEKRWGGSAGGPVYIPHLYNGQNKTFFMFGYEGIHDNRPRNDVTNGTVPSAAMKRGDFSELLALGSQYQIYNPFTRRSIAGGRIQADPFIGNIIPPNLINPVAAKVLSYYPDPRFTPVDATGLGNNQDPSLAEAAKYYNWTVKVDHIISDRQRIFVRYSAYTRNSLYDNYLSNYLLTGDAFQFLAKNGVIDDVYTFGPTTVLNVKFGYSRFIRADKTNSETGFDLTSLGFPASYNDAIPQDIRRFPQVTMTGYQGTGPVGCEFRPVEIYSLPITLSKAQGRHFLKIGMEFRAYRETDSFTGHNQTGSFAFDTTYTKGPLDNSTAAPSGFGQSVAALLLGLPTNASFVRRAASYAEQSTSWGFFVQDDWKVLPKLTMNFGLRWEFEGSLTERYNRTVTGFDYNALQPISAQAVANYALNPVAEIPVSQFKVQGGLMFAGVGNQPRGAYETPKKNIMPRFGIAYQLTPKTVIRTGYGIFFGFLGERRGDVIQTGFQQNTSFVPTLDNINFIGTLSNPFPNGILEPVGAALGAQTYLGQNLNYSIQGQGIAFFNPKPQVSYMQRWQFGIQRELPYGVVVEVAYIGNRGTHIELTRDLNVTPQKYLSTLPTRDATVINYLTANVTNPFKGLAWPAGATSTFTGTNIARERLMRPFPAFGTVSTTTNEGYSWYHGGELKVEKRFSKGYSVVLNYTRSKAMQAIDLLNSDDPRPTEMISDLDTPNRLSLSALLEFPFGPGHTFQLTKNAVLSRLIGGWQLSPIYTYQTGVPINFGTDFFFNGDPTTMALPADQRTVTRWFDTTNFVTASTLQPDHHVRTMPLRFSGVRYQSMSNWDFSLIKNTKLTEGKSIQFKLEALNAFNHPLLNNGTVTATVNPTSTAFGSTVGKNMGNYARRFQLGLKFVF
jgi:hypothetical protein